MSYVAYTDFVEQGSIDWFRARLGKITASQVSCILDEPRTKSKTWTDKAVSYMQQLAAERLLLEGQIMPSFSTSSMDWGKEKEEDARRHYEQQTGLSISEAQFKTLDGNSDIGASADGLVKKNMFDNEYNKVIEIKCPFNPLHHIKKFIEPICKEHYAQIQLNMMVHDIHEADYVSYQPLCKIPFYCKTYQADRGYQAKLLERCELFLKDLEKLLEKIKP